MFLLKIVLTIVIVVFILVVVVGQNPTVSDFFNSVKGKLQIPSFSLEQRDINFELTADSYPDFEFSGSGANITLFGNINGTLTTGEIKANEMTIYGFSGTGSVKDGQVKLSGKIEKIKLPEITVNVQETLTMGSGFTRLVGEGIEMELLEIKDSSGTLKARKTDTAFTGNVTIRYPAGNLELGNGLKMVGEASKIQLSNGITID